jgi:hypothetical protein
MRFELDRRTEYSDDAVLKEIRRVPRLVTAPQLSTKDFGKHARVHSATVHGRFGKWTNALVASVDRGDAPVEPNKGTIGAQLRWSILNRDRFRCVICGRTPERDRLCELSRRSHSTVIEGGTDLAR